jgi:hypothetical protein
MATTATRPDSQDRSLSPEERSEDLRSVDDLYQQKHAELRVDTRIFEEQ